MLTGPVSLAAASRSMLGTREIRPEKIQVQREQCQKGTGEAAEEHQDKLMRRRPAMNHLGCVATRCVPDMPGAQTRPTRGP